MSSKQIERLGNSRRLGFSTLAVHAGEDRQKLGDAITDPIFCAATYTFPDTQALIDFVEQKLPREEYGRYGNPGEKVVERKLAALEGGEAALLFASGMAAFAGLLMAKLSAGDEVVFFDECYHRTPRVLHQAPVPVRRRHATRSRRATTTAMEAAITPRTRLLISESPTNPHLSVVDLERFAAIGRKHGVETLIDATLATPYNVRPLRVRRRLRAALGHQVPGRPQRPAGRRAHRRGSRSWNRSASSAASWGRSTRRTTSTCCCAG